MALRGSGRFLAMMAMGLMVMLTAVDIAEARRAGGGFGSRGTRTFSAPPVTRTAPAPAAPIDRSMSTRPASQPAANPAQPGAAGQARPATRPGLFGGFGGTMLGGLMMGGLIGMMLGNGLGGGIGFLGLLLQAALVIGAIMLAMRFFGRSQKTAYAGPAAAMNRNGSSSGPAPSSGMPSFSIPSIGGGKSQPKPAVPDEIGIDGADLDIFETMLKNVQAAYANEDYAALRKLTTPEAMSYLAEELGDNATRGVKNDVRDVHLVQGDVSEAWQETGTDYATVAMRYESIDVLRNRETGAIVSGDPDKVSESVELWTFMRRNRGDWLVSAIQGVEDDAT